MAKSITGKMSKKDALYLISLLNTDTIEIDPTNLDIIESCITNLFINGGKLTEGVELEDKELIRTASRKMIEGLLVYAKYHELDLTPLKDAIKQQPEYSPFLARANAMLIPRGISQMIDIYATKPSNIPHKIVVEHILLSIVNTMYRMDVDIQSL